MEKLPISWTEATLGELFLIERGGSPRPIANYITDDKEGINWIKIGDTKGATKYIYETKEKIRKEGLSKSRMVYVDDFILSNSMSFGKPYIMKTEGCIHDGWLVIRQNKKVIDSNYLYYVLSSSFVYQQFSSLAKGSTVKNLNIAAVQKVRIPLPSLPEQKRIVAKLDTLFAGIENTKIRLEIIPQLLKNFRQAVLTQAVTGKLTEEWRKGKELEEWHLSTIGCFMQEIKDKIDPTTISETNYIGLEHFTNNGGIKSIGNSKDVKSNKSVFKKNDVLYGKLRPYLNKHDIANFDGICSTDILIYRNQNKASCSFFNYFLGTSDFIQKANSESKGINLPRISAKIINNFEISVPPLQEQQEIVRRVESLFAKVDAIEKQYEALKQKIDTLPQALLAKAFKGELVEQNPLDEPASVLLEEIQKAKESLKGKGKKKK